MNINCNLPLSFIKKEFLRELGITEESCTPPDGMGLVAYRFRIVYHCGAEHCRREVAACNTEEELNQAFLKWGRMSLYEWIESL